jgi:hypothetical protein
MQSAQVVALRNGEDFQFENEKDTSRRQIDTIRRLILAHQREHGC